jgi:hypothetical protein
MESSEMRKRIINLGKGLVKELGLDPGVDTLSRWMAHYVAELMTIAENATGDDRIEAERHCFETILKLWQHRSSLPNGRRPYESFESIFRALERLDPENKQPYYFNNTNENSLEPDKTTKVTESVQQWLDVAWDIDQIVRIWLDYVFKQAALCATDENTIAWLKNSVGLRDIDDTSIIIRLLPDNLLGSGEVSAESLQQKESELINDRIKKLEAFSDFNQKLLSILRKELEDVLEDGSSVDEDDLT